MTDKRRTISVSFSQDQIHQIDQIASSQRVQTGQNVTRSQIARSLLDAGLAQRGQAAPTPSPARQTTPAGGRSGERSVAATGGGQDGQEG